MTKPVEQNPKPWEELKVTQADYLKMQAEAIKAEQQLQPSQSAKNTSLAASQQLTQYDPFRIPLEANDINNVKKPEYWYEGYQIQYLLEESLNKKDFSVQTPISLNQNINSALVPDEQKPENVLKTSISEITEGNKKAAVIPIEMGYGHWTALIATYDAKDKQVILTFNDSLDNSINYDGQKLPKLIDQALGNLPNKPIIIDEQTKQQNNQSDCGVFTVDNAVRIANGQPILTTEQTNNKGPELRKQHAEILAKAMTKQQAQEIGQQYQNTQTMDNKFQKLVNTQSKNDKHRQR